MKQTDESLYSERVTLRVVLVAMTCLLIGISLLVVSAQWNWLKQHSTLQTVFEQMGGCSSSQHL